MKNCVSSATYPYNISKPLLSHLLENAASIEDMHFMLQKEVVIRICALSGTKKYGRLSVMMQYFCETEWLFDVPPENFNPAPQVMSVIVKLLPHEKPPLKIPDLQHFSRLVTQAFYKRGCSGKIEETLPDIIKLTEY